MWHVPAFFFLVLSIAFVNRDGALLTNALERVWELRALEGGGHIMPLLSRLPEELETPKLGNKHKNSFWCKLVKRAWHRFSWPSIQTKADSFNPQKAEEGQWNGLSDVSSQIWPQVNRFGARGQNVLESSTIFQTLSFSTITFDVFVLKQQIWHHRISIIETNRVPSTFAHLKKTISKFDLGPPGDLTFWPRKSKFSHNVYS